MVGHVLQEQVVQAGEGCAAAGIPGRQAPGAPSTWCARHRSRMLEPCDSNARAGRSRTPRLRCACVLKSIIGRENGAFGDLTPSGPDRDRRSLVHRACGVSCRRTCDGGQPAAHLRDVARRRTRRHRRHRPAAVVAWQPGSGWELRVAAGIHGANSSTCISRLRAPRHSVRSPSVTSDRASTASSPRSRASRSS